MWLDHCFGCQHNSMTHARLILVSNVLTWCATHLNIVSEWMGFWWMYLFVPCCFWMSTCALYLNLLYLSLFQFFFFFFAIHHLLLAFLVAYKCLWYNQNKSPTRRPFMLDVTKSSAPKHQISIFFKQMLCQVYHPAFFKGHPRNLYQFCDFFMFVCISLCVTNHLLKVNFTFGAKHFKYWCR